MHYASADRTCHAEGHCGCYHSGTPAAARILSNGRDAVRRERRTARVAAKHAGHCSHAGAGGTRFAPPRSAYGPGGSSRATTTRAGASGARASSTTCDTSSYRTRSYVCATRIGPPSFLPYL
jgi:hypothetical protein